ncbi:hypothetical protein FHS21_006269 [Phyllobacterium trifolii]|uniref:Uncharacterized protein n=1 Tax=Phyllobacterium trifolii TaxID=300193 RepID=A0A839UM88_9HYPH|nr:hypothetical protein [Phyllobacterium trifolii]
MGPLHNKNQVVVTTKTFFVDKYFRTGWGATRSSVSGLCLIGSLGSIRQW